MVCGKCCCPLNEAIERGRSAELGVPHQRFVVDHLARVGEEPARAAEVLEAVLASAEVRPLLQTAQLARGVGQVRVHLHLSGRNERLDWRLASFQPRRDGVCWRTGCLMGHWRRIGSDRDSELGFDTQIWRY